MHKSVQATGRPSARTSQSSFGKAEMARSAPRAQRTPGSGEMLRRQVVEAWRCQTKVHCIMRNARYRRRSFVLSKKAEDGDYAVGSSALVDREWDDERRRFTS